MHPSPPSRFLPYMDTLTKPLTPIPRPLPTLIPAPDTQAVIDERLRVRAERFGITTAEMIAEKTAAHVAEKVALLSLFFRGFTIRLFTVVESSEELIVLVVG